MSDLEKEARGRFQHYLVGRARHLRVASRAAECPQTYDGDRDQAREDLKSIKGEGPVAAVPPVELGVDYMQAERCQLQSNRICEAIPRGAAEQAAESCYLERDPSWTDGDHRLGIAVVGTKVAPIQRACCQNRAAVEASSYPGRCL